MKKFLKFFSIWEWMLLILSFALIFLSFFLSPIFNADRSVLALITSLIGVVGVIFMSRGSVVAHGIYIVFSVLYVFVSVSSRYYGEAIIYGALMLPIHIFSIVSWKKHMSEDKSVQISKSSGKEFFILLSMSVVLTVPFYFILRCLNTQNLIVGTISFVMSFLAAILMLRRNKYYAITFAIDDIISIILWGSHIFSGTYQYIPTLITVFVATANDIYSFICWVIRERKQKRKVQNEENIE